MGEQSPLTPTFFAPLVIFSERVKCSIEQTQAGGALPKSGDNDGSIIANPNIS